jgi:glycerol-3-phosphate dehydrogenase
MTGISIRKTDILIIGGGIGGVAVARELSKYDADVTLVEREVDVGWGQTKASYAIRHPDAHWPPGSLAQQMIAQGNQLMDRLIEDLDIEFKRTGELVLAFTREEAAALETMERQGKSINVQDMAIIGKNDVRRMEPNANPASIAALYMPTAGVFNPFDLLFAFYENARENGVNMLMDTEVKGISPEKTRFMVKTNRGEIEAGYIVNAAGLFAEKIARMAGTHDFKITFETKGSCLVLDTLVADRVQHIGTGLIDPKAMLRFKLVTPTFHGKVLLYTSMAEPSGGIEDRSVEKTIFNLTIESARTLVPEVD